VQVTVKLQDLDLMKVHTLKVAYAEAKKSRAGNNMITMLLHEVETGINVNAWILLDRRDSVTNFARAFNLPIVDGVLEFDTEELLDKEVKARLRMMDDGSYAVQKFVVEPVSVSIADLEDPFAEEER